MRARVGQLVAAAPTTVKSVPQYPTALSFTSLIRSVDSNWVTVELVSIQSNETTFTSPQKIDLRVDGAWSVVKTGQRNDIKIAGGKAHATRSGSAPDDNTAIVRIPRTDNTTPLDARWNLDYDSATIMLSNANQPALITFGQINLTLPQQLTLDPSTYPTPQALIERSFESAWQTLGWLKWPVAVLALWLLPNLALILNRLVAMAWKRLKDLWKKRQHVAVPSHTETATDPSPAEPSLVRSASTDHATSSEASDTAANDSEASPPNGQHVKIKRASNVRTQNRTQRSSGLGQFGSRLLRKTASQTRELLKDDDRS